MNLDVPFSQIMSTFVPPETPDVGSSVNFASSVEDLVTQTLEFTIEEVNADRNVSNNAKKSSDRAESLRERDLRY